MQRLQAQLDAQARAISEGMVGRVERVLVEGASKKNDAAGTPMQCNAARTVCDVVFVAPATEPSALPERTIRFP